MKSKEIIETVEVPQGNEVFLINNTIIVKGVKGEIKKDFSCFGIKLKKENSKIFFSIKGVSRRQKCVINSCLSHFKNMINGVNFGYIYKLKVCSSHFPINISIDKNRLIIKNFLGEKIPRAAEILDGVNVKIDGDVIIVDGIDKEKTGQVSANIERATNITHRDRRVFQDGIHMT